MKNLTTNARRVLFPSLIFKKYIYYQLDRIGIVGLNIST